MRVLLCRKPTAGDYLPGVVRVAAAGYGVERAPTDARGGTINAF